MKAYTLKLNRLQTTESPRLILVGGSNVAFDIDSQTLADSLKMNPINFGLNAGLSLRYIMRDVIRYTRPNDLILLNMNLFIIKGEEKVLYSPNCFITSICMVG